MSSVKDLLLLHHKHLGYHYFNLLSRLYSHLFEKTKREFFFVMLVSWKSILEAHMLVLIVRAFMFLS
jgi:hypothetical protein